MQCMLVMLYQKTPEPLLDLLQWKYDVWEKGEFFLPRKEASKCSHNYWIIFVQVSSNASWRREQKLCMCIKHGNVIIPPMQ